MTEREITAIIIGVFAVAVVLKVVLTIRSGKTTYRKTVLNKESDPLYFWGIIVAYCILATYLVSLIFKTLS